MAFIQKTTSPGFPALYNVEQAVGLNSPNKPGDVKLVQYLLKHYYKAPQIAVDGWIGPTTNTYIQKFQNDMKNAGNSVLADGRVDRAFGKVSSVSKTVYTILLMNFVVAKWNPKAYNDLPSVVPLNPNPSANPYSQGSSTLGGIVDSVVNQLKVVVTQAGPNGIQVTEVMPGKNGQSTTYTIPYFT